MNRATGRRRSPLLLLAAALLVGQATGLHHAHASGADCPPGTCFHDEAAADSHAQLVTPDDCPLCDLLHQGRTVTPSAAISAADAPAGDVRRGSNAGVGPCARPGLDGRGPRGPPRAA